MVVHPTFLVREILHNFTFLFKGNLNHSLQRKSCISAVAPLLLQGGRPCHQGIIPYTWGLHPQFPGDCIMPWHLGPPLLFKLVCKGGDSDSLRRFETGDVFSWYWRLRDWRIQRVWQNGYILSHKLSILQPIHSWAMVSMASSIISAKELQKTGQISLDASRRWCYACWLVKAERSVPLTSTQAWNWCTN
jgi:hypothetical protein